MSIIKLPDKRLKRVSESIDCFDTSSKDLAARLIREWKNSGAQKGLSAPQVGVNKRMILCRIKKEPIIMINPELTFKFGLKLSNEGCLSTGESRYLVWRPLFGWVRYYNIDGKQFKKYCNGDLIRVVCHEIDHLNGVCLSDKGWRLK